MSTTLKKIADQVVVITGASSGIGLATAELLAEMGASVVLAARSEKTLLHVAGRITGRGGRAIAVPCDVSDRSQVEALAKTAIRTFGRIDTWVNNAGLGMYGRADTFREEDARRLFDINFWGAVNGCVVALPHLKSSGGALITVGSEVSDSYAPLMSIYVATKHAIKGYVDVLRVEVEEVDKLPVAVTLIQPTAVDTPFPQHAKNDMPKEPKLPDPMIQAQDVAEAILHVAEHPTREKKVGAMSLVSTALSKLIPSVADRLSAGRVDDLTYDEKPRNPNGALYQASEATGVAGRTNGTGGNQPR
ncbi:SDR family oxidoreductase [Planctomyces sp. SH-PL14]|uniref:SDR family oxidoreductase n=1 Tax=Planctomyces sp. SH-PL14 TaxID=1632864 RepID=UPI00078BBF31|nr:SDR family oxidoreductase [Planctomyces sp. SH-PL14]AMV19236.1 putative oxidoreductase [Planctomyces sp. SH-PL14]